MTIEGPEGFIQQGLNLLLLLGRKARIDLDSTSNSGDITANKVHIVTAMDFPSSHVLYESWTTEKAERQRTDAFKLC